MSRAEELLNSLGETSISHKHEVPDSDTHFMIDPYSRQIENTNYQKTVLMRGDHNSERFTFEVPRYVDGHDMSLCNRVIVHFDNVGDSVENVYSDVAYMTDLRINPDKPDTVISSWLIRREATQIVGLLSFSIQYQCVEGDEITYEWNTDSYDDIEIRKSKNNGEAAIINYTNVLEQWRSQIFGAGESVMTNITTEGANQVAAVQTESASQQAAIELKGSETLATIPDDYTEVYNMANEALRTKADSIVCEAEGNVITINDAANDYIRRLKVYGKSTQNTTTGAQIIDAKQIQTVTMNGVTLTNNGDGSFTISGDGTLTDTFAKYYEYTHDETVKLLRAGPMKLITERTTNPYIYAQMVVDSVVVGTISNYKNKTEEINILQEWLDNNTSFLRIGFFGKTDANTSVGVSVRPMVYQDSDGTWEPFTGGEASPNSDYPQEIVSVENPTVEVCSDNLARSHRDGSISSTGLTVTQFNNSSEVIINGTATSATSITVLRDICLPVGQYTLSVYGLNIMNTSYDRAYIMDGSSNATVNYVQPDRPQTFNITHPSIVSISIVFAETSSYNNQTVKFQLERGSVATEYKAYTGKRLTLNHTLHGIPVTSGGNYTDENGQQWICDEVDVDRGVFIRRVERIVLDGSAAWNLYNYQTQYYGFHIWDLLDEEYQRAAGLCNQFRIVGGSSGDCLWIGVSNKNIYAITKEWYDKGLDAWKAHLNEKPLEVIYARNTPIETPLAAEEIMAYKALKSNYPNTTVLNNAGAWMNVKYNADLKLYTDKDKEKFAADIIDQFRDNVTTAQIGTVTLYASAWEGTNNLYSQVVNIDGVTANSQVDLTPGVDQLAVFYDKDLSFVTENDGGVVTVYAIGQKPANDYTIQVTITEVNV